MRYSEGTGPQIEHQRNWMKEYRNRLYDIELEENQLQKDTAEGEHVNSNKHN
jgi:hypothetical protein